MWRSMSFFLKFHRRTRALKQIDQSWRIIFHEKHAATSIYATFKNIYRPINSVSQKKSSPEDLWQFFKNGREFFNLILGAYYAFISTLYYKFLFNYLQLWRSYAILCMTTIMCSKCPSSTTTHAGWSHLIWHNFVTIGDNWTKICILAYVWMFNRHVKFRLKIPNYLGKMSENAF